MHSAVKWIVCCLALLCSLWAAGQEPLGTLTLTGVRDGGSLELGEALTAKLVVEAPLAAEIHFPETWPEFGNLSLVEQVALPVELLPGSRQRVGVLLAWEAIDDAPGTIPALTATVRLGDREEVLTTTPIALAFRTHLQDGEELHDIKGNALPWSPVMMVTGAGFLGISLAGLVVWLLARQRPVRMQVVTGPRAVAVALRCIPPEDDLYHRYATANQLLTRYLGNRYGVFLPTATGGLIRALQEVDSAECAHLPPLGQQLAAIEARRYGADHGEAAFHAYVAAIIDWLTVESEASE